MLAIQNLQCLMSDTASFFETQALGNRSDPPRFHVSCVAASVGTSHADWVRLPKSIPTMAAAMCLVRVLRTNRHHHQQHWLTAVTRASVPLCAVLPANQKWIVSRMHCHASVQSVHADDHSPHSALFPLQIASDLHSFHAKAASALRQSQQSTSTAPGASCNLPWGIRFPSYLELLHLHAHRALQLASFCFVKAVQKAVELAQGLCYSLLCRFKALLKVHRLTLLQHDDTHGAFHPAETMCAKLLTPFAS